MLESKISYVLSLSNMIIFKDHTTEVSVTRLNLAQTLCNKGLRFAPLWCLQVTSVLRADVLPGHLRTNPSDPSLHKVILHPTERSDGCITDRGGAELEAFH